MTIDTSTLDAGAEGVTSVAGTTIRWGWWPGSGRVRYAAADGVASLADWIARVEPRYTLGKPKLQLIVVSEGAHHDESCY